MAHQGLIHFYAACNTCGATCSARNVQGWAHQHVNRTGHEVELQMGFLVTGPAINPPKGKTRG